MNKLILILFLLFSIPNQSKSQGCLQADICILLDWSGSESGREGLISYAALQFSKELRLSDYHTKIAVILFETTDTLLVPLTSNVELIQQKLLWLAKYPIGGTTYIQEALWECKTQFDSDEALRSARKIIIIISDGKIYDTAEAVQFLSNAPYEINVYGILIGSDFSGLDDLVGLTGDSSRVSIIDPSLLLETLKKLDFCN